MLKIKSLIKNFLFKKKITQAFLKRMFIYSLEIEGIGIGGQSIYSNGESNIINKILSKETNPIVFDVGAQGGDYTSAVIKANNTAQVFAFEPCNRDYLELTKKFDKKITIVKSALGEQNGTIKLNYPPNVCGLSSIYKLNNEFTESEEVKIETIDSFCSKNNIDKITLLKLDVEGHEFACLKGAQQMLPNIKYIQFEISLADRESKVYFRDIFNFLKDYKIYRILRDDIKLVTTPGKIEEMLFTTNYIAIRNNEK